MEIEQQRQVEYLRAWNFGYARGYHESRGRDTEVLEAALKHITELHQSTGGSLSCEVAERIREALTQVKEETP